MECNFLEMITMAIRLATEKGETTYLILPEEIKSNLWELTDYDGFINYEGMSVRCEPSGEVHVFND